MGKPAARVGDEHRCEMVDPVTGIPHKGGVINSGNGTVLIGGQPAATVGDACKCVGGVPDLIISGSTGVFIGGKPAAREGDACAHGGAITTGLGSVLIGERGKNKNITECAGTIEEKEWKEPSQEEKVRAINKAIKTAIKLLTNTLQMLENKDSKIAEKFKKWFGRDDDVSKQIIADRISKSLSACQTLTFQSFIPIYNEDDREKEIAKIYNEDNPPVIYTGNLFWKCGEKGRPSRSSAIIHELSHFVYIGKTEDVIYGEKRCEDLAKDHPNLALKNADSYELFIVT